MILLTTMKINSNHNNFANINIIKIYNTILIQRGNYSYIIIYQFFLISSNLTFYKRKCKNYPFNYFLCLIIIICLYQIVILEKKERYISIHGYILYIIIYVYIYLYIFLYEQFFPGL